MALFRYSIIPVLLAGAALSAEPPQATLDAKHRAFFKDHCLTCHNAEKQKGKVRLDNLSFILDSVEQADLWQKVLNSVNAGEMPPEDEKQPERAAKTDFLEALSQTLVTARRVLSDSGGKIVVRRLNRREYANTIRDLLGVQIDVSNLPPDSGNGTFDTVGSSLFMSSDQVEQYLTLGRQALQDAHALQAAGAKPLKIHSEVEKVAAVQLRGSIDHLTKKVAPYHQWTAAVDAAGARLENKGKAARIRALDEVIKEPERFYRHWAEIKGAPSPVQFGFKDPAEGEALKQYFDEGTAYLAKYFQLPHVDKGSYLFVFIVRAQEHIIAPKEWPPGRYMLRVRMAALPETPKHRHFIEAGHPSQPGAYDIFSAHHVTGSIEQPQTIEIPVTLTSTGSREFAIREKRLNSREAEVGIAVTYRNKNKTWYPPAMWIDWIELEGPLPPESQLNLSTAQSPREIIADFTEKAFRGAKPDAAFIDGLVALYDKRRAAGDAHPQALQEAMSIVLAAPGFLYLGEPSEPGKTRPLTRAELACRLSYFLWSAPPDDALLQADLNKPDVLAREVDRLIASPKSREFVTGFVHQWLGLDRLDFFRFNGQMFPQFDDSAKMAARHEVFETFAHLLHGNSSLTRLLKSDQIIINGLLANLYGIEGVTGDAFRPVTLAPDSPRGGLLGMAAIMAMGSNGERTSPVERGAWVLRHLLHNPPPPAPPNVPQLSRLADKPLSPRERLAAHMEEAQCASCHRKIDPIGFGLENFDTIGQWRNTELYTKAVGGRKDWPIDPAGAFHKGPAFKDYFELRDLVAARGDDFARGFTEALIEYGLGRPYGFTDDALASDIVARAKEEDFAIRAFIQALVASGTFGKK
jgi:mono/diheme cytochrome c family protein